MPDENLGDDVALALAALAEIVYERPDYEEIYAAITRTAVEVVPGCDHAAISILAGGGEMTVHAPTSDVARLVDDIEAELREGPCYDAIVEEAFQMDTDLTEGTTWPELGRRVLAETCPFPEDFLPRVAGATCVPMGHADAAAEAVAPGDYVLARTPTTAGQLTVVDRNGAAVLYQRAP